MGYLTDELLGVLDEVPEKLSAFIRKTVLEDFNKKGTVIGVSGGIDSAVSLVLAVKGLGRERVFAMVLPEKESSPSSRTLGLQLIHDCQVAYEEVPITPILECCGVYAKKQALISKLYPSFNPEIHKTSLFLPPDVVLKGSLSIPQLRIVENGRTIAEKRLHAQDLLDIMSIQNTKQRTRMLLQYMVAEKTNFAVCGTTNKTEMVTGHFVKYGDGGVDLEPLADLYKTQVYGIAKRLGIDQGIISRPPSPDTWSNYVSDMDFYWRMPYEILDELLYAEEKGYSLPLIEKSTGLSQPQIHRAVDHITHMKRTAKYLASSPTVYSLSPK
ncbi:MAG: NAD(+) synthase [Methanomicrobiales archaeon]|nr:NAD(+) synthase [Methanomicrobiales archaeon]